MKKKQKNTMEQNLSTENIENAVDLGSEVQSNMDINEQEVNQMQRHRISSKTCAALSEKCVSDMCWSFVC